MRSTSTSGGLALRASLPWKTGSSIKVRQLLTKEERAHLSVIASLVRFKKRERLVRAGGRADAIYNIISGTVKSFVVGPDRRECINGFLYTGDMVGLSEEGIYVNSIEAITPVTAYRLPVERLQSRLRSDAALQFHVICKLCQELRQAQHHSFLLSRREAVAKIAMFLQLIEELQVDRGEPANEIYLPMNRTEMGQFAGLSLAAIGRTFRKLTSDGVIKFRDRQHVGITDRAAFNRLQR
jgi:CRP-like cAMP-binding protein